MGHLGGYFSIAASHTTIRGSGHTVGLWYLGFFDW